MIVKEDMIFVVDDDQAVRESLKFALELEGLAVRACGSGTELLDHPDLRRAQCIVLDYRMPAMDGLAVLDGLATRKVAVPVILITSQATGDLCRRALAAGAVDVLEKPFLDSGLIDSIHGVLCHAKCAGAADLRRIP
jgi:FixJ family two-component response regulator